MKKIQFCFHFNLETRIMIMSVTITAKSRFCFIARTLDSSKSENTPPNRLSHSSRQKMGLAGLGTDALTWL